MIPLRTIITIYASESSMLDQIKNNVMVDEEQLNFNSLDSAIEYYVSNAQDFSGYTVRGRTVVEPFLFYSQLISYPSDDIMDVAKSILCMMDCVRSKLFYTLATNFIIEIPEDIRYGKRYSELKVCTNDFSINNPACPAGCVDTVPQQEPSVCGTREGQRREDAANYNQGWLPLHRTRGEQEDTREEETQEQTQEPIREETLNRLLVNRYGLRDHNDMLDSYRYMMDRPYPINRAGSRTDTCYGIRAYGDDGNLIDEIRRMMRPI